MTASGTISSWDTIVSVDASAGSVALVLPVTNATSKGHSLDIIRIDSSNNIVSIDGNGTDLINNSSNLVYLYGQNDSIEITSLIGDSKINNNRNSTGSTANYLCATLSTAQSTNLSSNDHVKFDTVVSNYGNKITLDTSTAYTTSSGTSIGRFTVKAGSSYNIDFDPAFMTLPASAWGTFLVYNVTTGSNVASSGWQSFTGTGNSSYGSISTIFNAITDSILEIRMTIGAGSINSLGSNLPNIPRLRITEVNRQATVINSVDYAYGTITSTTVLTGSPVVATLSPTSGNLSVASNTINLIAGKTYNIIVSARVTNAINGTTAINASINNITNSTVLTSGSLCPATWTNNSDMPNGTMICTITPQVNTQIQIIGNNVGGNSPAMSGTYIVIQAGTTATTGVPQNLIEKIQYDITGASDITLNEMWGTKQIYRRTKEGNFGTTANGFALTTLPTGATPLNIRLMGKSTSGVWYNLSNTSSDVAMDTSYNITSYITVTSFNSQPYKLTVDYIK
jgi:hypothetical protein